MDTQTDTADIHTAEQISGLFLAVYFAMSQPDANIKKCNILSSDYTQ